MGDIAIVSADVYRHAVPPAQPGVLFDHLLQVIPDGRIISKDPAAGMMRIGDKHLGN